MAIRTAGRDISRRIGDFYDPGAATMYETSLAQELSEAAAATGAAGGPYQTQAAAAGGLDYYRGDHGYYGGGTGTRGEERGRYQSHYDDEADPRYRRRRRTEQEQVEVGAFSRLDYVEPQEGYEEEGEEDRKELVSEPSPEQYSEASSVYRDESLRGSTTRRGAGRDDGVARESLSKGPHHEEKPTLTRDHEGSKRHHSSTSGQRRPDPKEKHEKRARKLSDREGGKAAETSSGKSTNQASSQGRAGDKRSRKDSGSRGDEREGGGARRRDPSGRRSDTAERRESSNRSRKDRRTDNRPSDRDNYE